MNDAGDEHAETFPHHAPDSIILPEIWQYSIANMNVETVFNSPVIDQLPKSGGNFEEGVITTHATPTRQGCDGAGPDEPAATTLTATDQASTSATDTTGDTANV